MKNKENVTSLTEILQNMKRIAVLTGAGISPDPTPLTSYSDFSFRGKAGEILPLIDEELNIESQD